MRKNTVVVYTAVCAKEMLKLGYTIIDLMKDKNDEDGKRTVFVFKNEKGLEEAIRNFSFNKPYIR